MSNLVIPIVAAVILVVVVACVAVLGALVVRKRRQKKILKKKRSKESIHSFKRGSLSQSVFTKPNKRRESRHSTSAIDDESHILAAAEKAVLHQERIASNTGGHNAQDSVENVNEHSFINYTNNNHAWLVNEENINSDATMLHQVAGSNSTTLEPSSSSMASDFHSVSNFLSTGMTNVDPDASCHTCSTTSEVSDLSTPTTMDDMIPESFDEESGVTRLIN